MVRFIASSVSKMKKKKAYLPGPHTFKNVKCMNLRTHIVEFKATKYCVCACVYREREVILLNYQACSCTVQNQ